ncbi:MAG: hypothetical protein WCT45_00270 [Candidatus Paceibacterota bacterium]|jgi:hypothetical protein
MNNIHTETINTRWSQFTLAQQMASVASEFARLSSWCAKGNETLAKSSAARTIDLVDAMLRDSRWKGRELEFRNLKVAVESMVAPEHFGTVGGEAVQRSLAPFFALAALS